MLWSKQGNRVKIPDRVPVLRGFGFCQVGAAKGRTAAVSAQGQVRGESRPLGETLRRRNLYVREHSLRNAQSQKACKKRYRMFGTVCRARLFLWKYGHNSHSIVVAVLLFGLTGQD
jgi:hypothetical protein